MNMPRTQPRQRGFLIIAAVFLLVVLAGLVAYLSTVSSTSQAASAADLNSARAYQAARAGAEWGAYLVLHQPPIVGVGTLKTDCEAGATTKTLAPGSLLAAFTVTVTCTSATYTEGASSVTVYSIASNACNEATGGGACPNPTTVSSTYVDREVSLTITN